MNDVTQMVCQQVRGGLGEVAQHQRNQDHGGQGADDEHRTPAERFDQHDRQRSGCDGTHVISGHQQRRRGTAALPLRELVDQGQRRRQCAAESDSGEEAEQSEEERIGRHGAEERENGERRNGIQKGAPAADDVGQRPDDQCADGHADQAESRDERDRSGGQTPVLVVEE